MVQSVSCSNLCCLEELVQNAPEILSRDCIPLAKLINLASLFDRSTPSSSTYSLKLQK